jgi:hypothetical protein
MVNYGDGHIAVGRMMAHDLGPEFYDRGGYFVCSTDWGENWIECLSRIEATRTGWVNIDQMRDAAGAEVVVSHAGINVNVGFHDCPNVWSPSVVCDPTALWPRVAVGDSFVVQIAYPGLDGLALCRSWDAGTSWDILPFEICTNSNLGDTDPDGYDITARGSSVAAVCAGYGTDVLLALSTDFGTSWQETVIYDIDETWQTPDEFVPDGSCGVIFDGNDNPHVIWGTYYSPGDGTILLSLDAGIMHWSEATGIQVITFPLRDTTICAPLGRDGNYASSPDIAVDSNSGVYVTYSQTIPERDINGNCYEHIYAVRSTDGGFTWDDSLDITLGTGFDASFPSLADFVDDTLRLVYNSDPFAGNFLQGNHEQIRVAVVYLEVPVSTFPVGVSEKDEGIPRIFSLEQNYPNPFNTSTRMIYRVGSRGWVDLRIFDVLGREAARLVSEEKSQGTYEVEWDASGFASGVYVARLQAGSFVDSKKLILLR